MSGVLSPTQLVARCEVVLRRAVRLGLTTAIASGATGCSKAPAPPAQPDVVVAAPAPASPLPPPPMVGGKPAAITAGFVVIPKGTFTMGLTAAEADDEDALWNSKPHSVTLTHTIEMQKTEVTVADYAAVMPATAEQKRGEPNWPVAHVSWPQAAQYCNQLSRRSGYAPCYEQVGLDMLWFGHTCEGYRLPTEAEWEYAARAGSTEARYAALDAIAWTEDNSAMGEQGMQRHPVGQKQPNAFGLHDMLGNVAEWVQDWDAPYADGPATNPKGPDKADNKVFRGGSFAWPGREARAGFRTAYGPGNQVGHLGFRCVRTLPEGP